MDKFWYKRYVKPTKKQCAVNSHSIHRKSCSE